MSVQIENLPPARPTLKEFGAFAEHIGIRLVEWELDRRVIEFDFTDQNLNGTGVIHGGCLATKLDTDIAHSAIYCTVPENYRSEATVNLSVNFVAAGRPGSQITIEARKMGGGRTMFMSVAEALDESGTVIGNAQDIGPYRGGCHKPERLPRPQGVELGKSPQRLNADDTNNEDKKERCFETLNLF